ncbi:MAG: alpha/beta fold hydrolase [Puniceicoccaceae bacterium]
MTQHLRAETLKEFAEIQELFPFRSKFVKLPHRMADREIPVTAHYVDEGEGEVLVFVHGNPTWSFYFRKVILQLKDRYRCIALDHIGCGLSEKGMDHRYSLKDRSLFLEQFLDALEVKQCHLVVHDWGGAIGMAFATRNAARVRSVTVTNTAAFPSDWISWRIQLCRLPLIGRWINYHFNGFLRAAMHMTTMQPLDAQVRKAYLLPYRRKADRESIDQFVKDIPMRDTHPSYSELKRTGDELSKFRDSQILLLWGMRDFCFAPCFLQQWRQRFPSSKAVEFEDADHFLFEEKAEACAELIATHVNGNLSGVRP